MQSTNPMDVALTPVAHHHHYNIHVSYWLVLILFLLLTQACVLSLQVRRLRKVQIVTGSGVREGFSRDSLICAAVVIGAIAAFIAIAVALGTGGGVTQLDQAFWAAFPGARSPRTLAVFSWFTYFGDARSLALLCIVASAVMLVRHQRMLALACVAAIGGNGLFNAALKHLFEHMRPPHEQGMPTYHEFGFPSGHSSGAVAAYGMLAYVLWRTLPKVWHVPVMLLAALTIGLVGVSRIILHAHFAGDVLAGLASGTAWLFACILGLELHRQLESTVPPANQPRAFQAAAWPLLQ